MDRTKLSMKRSPLLPAASPPSTNEEQTYLFIAEVAASARCIPVALQNNSDDVIIMEASSDADDSRVTTQPPKIFQLLPTTSASRNIRVNELSVPQTTSPNLVHSSSQPAISDEIVICEVSPVPPTKKSRLCLVAPVSTNKQVDSGPTFCKSSRKSLVIPSAANSVEKERKEIKCKKKMKENERKKMKERKQIKIRKIDEKKKKAERKKKKEKGIKEKEMKERKKRKERKKKKERKTENRNYINQEASPDDSKVMFPAPAMEQTRQLMEILPLIPAVSPLTNKQEASGLSVHPTCRQELVQSCPEQTNSDDDITILEASQDDCKVTSPAPTIKQIRQPMEISPLLPAVSALTNKQGASGLSVCQTFRQELVHSCPEKTNSDDEITILEASQDDCKVTSPALAMEQIRQPMEISPLLPAISPLTNKQGASGLSVHQTCRQELVDSCPEQTNPDDEITILETSQDDCKVTSPAPAMKQIRQPMKLSPLLPVPSASTNKRTAEATLFCQTSSMSLVHFCPQPTNTEKEITILKASPDDSKVTSHASAMEETMQPIERSQMLLAASASTNKREATGPSIYKSSRKILKHSCLKPANSKEEIIILEASPNDSKLMFPAHDMEGTTPPVKNQNYF